MSQANHSKAPQSAAFVAAMREVFGDVRVLYVKENDLLLGEPAAGPWVPVSYIPELHK